MLRIVYNETEKANYMRKWQASGQRAAQYVKKAGLKESKFYKWVAKDAKEKRDRSSECFVEIPVKSSEEAEPTQMRLLIRAKGLAIEIPATVESVQLKRVLEVLVSL